MQPPPSSSPEPARGRREEQLARLAAIIDRLRAADGCPWDRQQTLESMVPCVQEEVGEVSDAVAAGVGPWIREELGDLLMNVFLMSRIAEQAGRFALADVAEEISDKLLRRHPHVFGERRADTPEQALASWESAKSLEKKEERRSLLDGLPSDVSALRRSAKVIGKAASVGFDWDDANGALDKVQEELGELREALDEGGPRAEAELGDLLFAVACAGRLLRLDSDVALRKACARFERRFRFLEERLGERLAESSLEEKEQLWQQAKAEEL